MPFLLRVELPDVPGSLGRVASAIGEAGGDIEAIEIIEKASHGVAVDDVLLEIAPGVMPDAIVSACSELDGVKVLWISRYAAGGNVFLDLEAVEDLTAHPGEAFNRLVELAPAVFRSDWAARVASDGTIVHATETAPSHVPWVQLDQPARLDVEDEINLYVGAVLNEDEIVVIGRRGGPEYLDSELARLHHLAALTLSISRTAR